MTKPQIISQDHIHIGDVIGIGRQSKLGLVFSVIKSNDGQVSAFKIIPIHVHPTEFRHPNDDNNLMLPTSLKEEINLSANEQHRVEFILEDYEANPEDVTIRYAKGSSSIFSSKTIARMDAKIREERRISELEQAEDRVYVFHKDIPTHVRERQKPGRPHIPNITIDDAKNFGLIGETLYQVLSRGTYGRKNHIATLREAYDMASSAKPDAANKYASILKTGLLASTVTLRTAFQDGAINESAAFNKLRDIDINRLGAAVAFLSGGQLKANQALTNQYINAYDQEHFRIQPFLYADKELDSAWKTFMDIAGNRPEILQKANVRYMYPT